MDDLEKIGMLNALATDLTTHKRDIEATKTDVKARMQRRVAAIIANIEAIDAEIAAAATEGRTAAFTAEHRTTFQALLEVTLPAAVEEVRTYVTALA